MTKWKIEWTKAQDNYIRKNFGKVKFIEMVNHLNVSKTAVYKRINDILDENYRSRCHWTEVENELLLLHYGKMTLKDLAYRLKRTEQAIISQLYFMEGSSDVSLATGLLKSHDIAEIMGVNPKTVTDWVNKGWINCYKPNYKFVFNEDYFWSWLKDNMDKVNYKRVEEYILMTSPEWYRVEVKRKQREIYSNEKLNKYNTPYSPIENTLILDFRNKGYTYERIAKEVNRTPTSVRFQIYKLKREKEAKAS